MGLWVSCVGLVSFWFGNMGNILDWWNSWESRQCWICMSPGSVPFFSTDPVCCHCGFFFKKILKIEFLSGPFCFGSSVALEYNHENLPKKKMVDSEFSCWKWRLVNKLLFAGLVEYGGGAEMVCCDWGEGFCCTAFGGNAHSLWEIFNSNCRLGTLYQVGTERGEGTTWWSSAVWSCWICICRPSRQGSSA